MNGLPVRKLMVVFGPLLLLASLLAGPAKAAPVEGLFESVVPVAGQGAEQRKAAIRDAFRKMLIKVTGNRAVVKRSELKGVWAQASRYVQQYRYELLPLNESASAGVVNPALPDRLLQVAFDAPAVTRLLQGHHVSVWAGDRPSGLVWLGVEEKGGRRLGLPDLDAQAFDALQASARDRGLPLLHPLMDLEDRASLQISDLWGDFELNIRKASARYSPDVIVTGRLVNVAASRWRAHWRLYQGDQVSSWSDEANSKALLTTSGIDHVVDVLSEKYAPTSAGGDLSEVRLQISGVTDLTIYSRISRFLASQSVVEDSALVESAADMAIFRLQVRGGLQSLQQGLQLGGLIEPASEATDPGMDDGSPVDLLYVVR